MFLINCKRYFVQMIILSQYPNTNSATTGDARASDYGIIGKEISEGIKEGVMWLVHALLYVSSPIIEWGCKFSIVFCIIIYFGSKEEKYISSAIKWCLVFVVFCAIRSALTI